MGRHQAVGCCHTLAAMKLAEAESQSGLRQERKLKMCSTLSNCTCCVPSMGAFAISFIYCNILVLKHVAIKVRGLGVVGLWEHVLLGEDAVGSSPSCELLHPKHFGTFITALLRIFSYCVILS